jgi:hypothetical protein
MIRNLIMAAAMFSLVALAACSSSLGDTPTDLPGEGVSAPVSCANPDDLTMVEQCPLVPYVNNVTALSAFEDLKAVADAALGVEGVWVGSISGSGIGRDGKSAGTGLSGWTTAWFTGPVEDPDMLVFDTTGGTCRVQNRCACATNGSCLDFDSINMPVATRPTAIAQDSDAAILAAFPTDSEDQKYDMVWNGVTGQWTVTRVGAVVDVDVVEPDVVPDDVVLADFSEV